MRIPRQTAHKWWRRYQEAGRAGLVDRSSRPRRCPTKTPAKVERRLVELRRRHQLGPARLAPRAGMPASTLHRVLGPPWGLAALGPRAPERPGHSSDRDHPAGRARPHRRKEAGQDPAGWWLEGQRTRTRTRKQRPRRPTPTRLRLHPLGHRRLLQAGLLRGPRKRAGHHCHRFLAPGPGLLRLLRHHRRAGTHRQRLLLSLQGLRAPNSSLPP